MIMLCFVTGQFLMPRSVIQMKISRYISMPFKYLRCIFVQNICIWFCVYVLLPETWCNTLLRDQSIRKQIWQYDYILNYIIYSYYEYIPWVMDMCTYIYICMHTYSPCTLSPYDILIWENHPCASPVLKIQNGQAAGYRSQEPRGIVKHPIYRCRNSSVSIQYTLW